MQEQELGTIIDLANTTVSYKTLGIENLALIKTSRGHMAVSPCFAIPKLEATDWIFSVEAIGAIGFGAWACWAWPVVRQSQMPLLTSKRCLISCAHWTDGVE